MIIGKKAKTARASENTIFHKGNDEDIITSWQNTNTQHVCVTGIISQGNISNTVVKQENFSANYKDLRTVH